MAIRFRVLALNLRYEPILIMHLGAGMQVEAKPHEYSLDLGSAALLIIDMQRDFLEPGGFGEMLGNDVSQLRRTIEPNKALLAA